MLKTITKFVVERRRLVRQRRQQVIREADGDGASSHSEVPQREGDNSDSSRHSKVPPQLAEPQLGEPPAPTVWGKLMVQSWKAVRLRRTLGRVRRRLHPRDCARRHRRQHPTAGRDA